MVLSQASLCLAFLYLLRQFLHVGFLIHFAERVLIILRRWLIILANATILATFLFFFLVGGITVTISGPILGI